MKYQPTPSPDYKAIFHFGTEDPENDKAPLPNGDMQLHALAAVISYSPTQNIDIFNDNLLLANGGSIAETRRNVLSSDEEVAILRERWKIVLDTQKIPAEGRQLDYLDYYGVRHNGPDDTLFGRASYGSMLWVYPYGAFWTINDYVNHNQLSFPEFYGANTATMVTRNASLTEMRDELFTKIIVGQTSVNDFDSYVDSWKAMGGTDITREVNEWRAEVVGS
jgi:hypothetical protein